MGGASSPFRPATDLWFCVLIRVATSFARSCSGISDVAVLCDFWTLCKGNQAAGGVCGMRAEVDCEELEECMPRGISEDKFIRYT